MKNAVLLTVVLMFAASVASAAIVVNPIDLRDGDQVKYVTQTYSGYTGRGGPFTWSFYSAAPSDRTTPPVVGTLFYTFCTEVTQYVPNPGGILTVSGLQNAASLGFTPSSYFKTSEGIYAFEKWSNNPTYYNSTSYSAATQAIVWESENIAPINYGINPANYTSEIAALTSGWDTSWRPVDESVIIWGNSQDQLFLSTVESGGSGAVPEPATIIVWSLLVTSSWLGMRVWRRRGRIGVTADVSSPAMPTARRPWSPEARQAIHEIIARANR
jgi:hypothetical protein